MSDIEMGFKDFKMKGANEGKGFWKQGVAEMKETAYPLWKDRQRARMKA